MASKRKISTVVAFEGEQQYKKTIDDITKEHTKLKKELELVTAEFKATGDAEKMFTEKSKLLNKQIEGQNKAIKTAEDALKKLKDNGVDKSSAAWALWEKNLTDAKTTMFKAQAELNKLNDTYKDTAEATEQVTQATERATQETADYSETLKSIDKGVKFGNILNGLRVIKDAVGGVISTAYRMGKALVMSQISGGDWAREIMTEAAKAGVSVEEYQARLYAQAVSGIDTNAITEGVKKTTENLATTDTELLKLYNDLGISTRNVNGDVRDATDTFWDSVDALKKIEDQTTRSIYAQKLLGDQYLELRGLVDLGSEGYEKLIEEGKATATVTEESVNALADMDAAVEKVNATSSTLKNTVNAELAPGFSEMAGAFTEVLQEFDTFLQSDDGQRVFNNWNETLSGIAKTIRETDFTDAFKVISESLNVVVGAFEAAFKAATAVKEMVDWVIGNEDIRAFLGLEPKPEPPRIEGAIDYENLTPQEEKQLAEGTYVFTPNFKVETPTSRARAEANEKLKSLLEALQGVSPDYFADQLAVAQMEAQYADLFKNQNLADAWQSVIDRVDSDEIANYQDVDYARIELLEALKTAMEEFNQSAESGGGGAMTAFNEAIEKGTLDTEDTLKSGVAAAFSDFDSLFASMGTANGSAYINALSAQMSRINSMLSLSPSYAYGGTFGSAAQSAYASPTSGMLNASIYVGKQKFGELTTPIVNAQLGADLQTIR